jgi:hypothetical protein
MSTSIEYASFLVRLWRQIGGELENASVEWHGEIEHIQTGKRRAFDTLEDLLDFLRREATSPTACPDDVA